MGTGASNCRMSDSSCSRSSRSNRGLEVLPSSNIVVSGGAGSVLGFQHAVSGVVCEPDDILKFIVKMARAQAEQHCGLPCVVRKAMRVPFSIRDLSDRLQREQDERTAQFLRCTLRATMQRLSKERLQQQSREAGIKGKLLNCS